MTRPIVDPQSGWLTFQSLLDQATDTIAREYSEGLAGWLSEQLHAAYAIGLHDGQSRAAQEKATQ